MKWCKLKWITTEIVFSCWTHWSTQSTKQIDVYLYMIQTTRRSWFHKSSTSFYEINLYHKTLTLYSNSLTTYRPIYSDFCSIGDDITLYAVTCNQHLLELLHRTSDLGFGIHVQAKSFFISSAWLYPDGLLSATELRSTNGWRIPQLDAWYNIYYVLALEKIENSWYPEKFYGLSLKVEWILIFYNN